MLRREVTMPAVLPRPRENRCRDALLGALLPGVGPTLPGLGQLDLSAFWQRFEAAAPAHLRLGLRLAVVGAAVLAPVLLYGRTLPALTEDQRDAVLQRAAGWPLLGPLLDVAKVVACMAYFADAGVQSAARGQ